MNYELLGMFSKINKNIKEQTEVLKLIENHLYTRSLSKADTVKMIEDEIRRQNQSRLIDSDNPEEALKALEDKIDVLVEMKIQDVLYKMLSAID